MAVADCTFGRRGQWRGRGGTESGQERAHGAPLAATLCGQRGGWAVEGRHPPARAQAADGEENQASREPDAQREAAGCHPLDSHSDTPEGLKHAIQGRIQALANVHRLFVESRWAGAELHCLVKQELAAYCPDGERRARIDGPKLLMRPDVAQVVAVALHELATNATKDGALSVAEGHLRVEWSRASDGRLVIRWTETGGPPGKPPTVRASAHA